MRLAITGHRPDKIGAMWDDVIEVFYDTFMWMGPSYLYQGMAPGADLLGAYAAFRTNRLPFEAVLPYAGHREMMKTKYWDTMWASAQHYADRVEILSDSETYPGHWCMFNRNHYMVDHADEVLALFDGNFGRGGTQETVAYAITHNKPVHVIHPDTLEVTFDAYKTARQ